jgi:hypothetical protein
MALPQNHAQPMLSSDLRFAQDRLVLPGSGGARVGFRNFGDSLLATILRNPDLDLLRLSGERFGSYPASFSN